MLLVQHIRSKNNLLCVNIYHVLSSRVFCLIGIFVKISRHLVKSAILLSILVTFTKTCLVTNKLRINVKDVFTFIVFILILPIKIQCSKIEREQ